MSAQLEKVLAGIMDFSPSNRGNVPGMVRGGDYVHKDHLRQEFALTPAVPDSSATGSAWTLTAPDGRSWFGESPIKALAAERNERIPANIQLERIFAAVEETRNDEEAKCRASYDNTFHKIKATIGYDDWRMVWLKAVGLDGGTPPAASGSAEPVYLIRDPLWTPGSPSTEWHEATEYAYSMTPEKMRRLLYAGAPPSPQGKYDDVLRPFAALMARELHANASKGDRPGWLKMDANTALLEIYWHTAKLSAAVKNNNGPGIEEHSADVANMAMMLLDVCGGLACLVTPASVNAKDAERLGWMCRHTASITSDSVEWVVSVPRIDFPADEEIFLGDTIEAAIDAAIAGTPAASKGAV